MKTLSILVGMIAMAFLPLQTDAQAQSAQDSKAQMKAANPVAVYYFHYTRRCHTCNEVEAQAQKALQELYPDLMKSGKITFASLNLEEAEGKRVAGSVGANGQSLLVVKDGKSYDLTDKAFLYATTTPAKLKQELQKAIGKI
ncbi:MAG: hypothetical protein KA053_05535 [Lentimicrobiaceae bacterium]|nr:hypothetical protein [Lentimicrobiaceae bacterium]